MTKLTQVELFGLIERLNKDLKESTLTLSTQEARFLVDYYYIIQEDRKRAFNQIRSVEETEEPHRVLDWLAGNAQMMENAIKSALDYYGKNNPLGEWCHSITGIGPVITAGLLAYVDLEKAPTTGHIWRYAGLDPTVEWLSETKAKQLVKKHVDKSKIKRKIVPRTEIEKISVEINRTADSLYNMLNGFFEKEQFTEELLIKTLKIRPWNNKLKTLCFKIGNCFQKVCNKPDALYGHVYAKRKAEEIVRNEAGAFKDQAKEGMKRVSKSTDAYKSYKEGKLPPGHLDMRARRYAVKLFLSHYHDEGYRRILGIEPPLPYAIANLDGHVHMVEPSNSSKKGVTV